MEEKTIYNPGMEAPDIDRPGRVVSLVPSITESLFDLGLGEKLVAITDYCIYPTDGVADLPRIGGTKNPNVQQIIELAPDLVFANGEENRKEDVETLEEAGITVWVTLPTRVSDVFTLLWNIMYLFDETSMATRVRLIEQSYDWVSGISLGRNPEQPCRVFAPIWWDPLMTFNAETYAHDLLRVCGGTNVFAGRERQFPLKADLGQVEPLAEDDPRVAGRDRRYPRVTMDEVAAAQPDVILLPSEPFPFDERHIPEFASLDVPAVREDRIFPIDGSLLTWHGTRVAYALNTLPALLCPTDE